MGGFDKIQEREGGLKRQLTSRQMTMIALGGAIGTGLFLGSKFAIGLAGPSVIISYAIGGLIALLLMGSLSEMTVAHPTSGSFGAFAEHYVSPLAGFLVKYMYWSCIVLAVGTEVTAVGEYMKLWFPDVPSLLWVIFFSAVLIGVNTMNVKVFGTWSTGSPASRSSQSSRSLCSARTSSSAPARTALASRTTQPKAASSPTDSPAPGSR